MNGWNVLCIASSTLKLQTVDSIANQSLNLISDTYCNSKLDKKPATTKEQKVKAEKGAAAGAAASPSHRGSDKSTSKAAGGAPISNAPISMDKIYAVDNEVEVDEHPVQPKSKPGSQPGSQPKSQPKSQLPPRQASQAAAAAPAPGNVTATASDKAIPSTTGTLYCSHCV